MTITTGVGITEIFDAPNARKKFGRGYMGYPPLIVIIKPLKITNIAKVCKNGLTPTFTIIMPLKNPINNPLIRAINQAITGLNPRLTDKNPPIKAEIPRVDSIDKSNFPINKHRHSAMTNIPKIEEFRIRSNILDKVKNCLIKMVITSIKIITISHIKYSSNNL
jgi:hypothetical protein